MQRKRKMILIKTRGCYLCQGRGRGFDLLQVRQDALWLQQLVTLAQLQDVLIEDEKGEHT